MACFAPYARALWLKIYKRLKTLSTSMNVKIVKVIRKEGNLSLKGKAISSSGLMGTDIKF